MVRNRRQNSWSIQNTLKDYGVPIVGALVLCIIAYSFLGGGSSENTSTNLTENKNPTVLSFGTQDTEAYIIYPDDTKEEITPSSLFYKGQSVIVKEGSLKLVSPEKNTIHLNKIGELTYNIDGSYELSSSDAWMETVTDTKISLRYANVDSRAGSVISLSQNEAASTIYVLFGSVKVSNMAGVQVSLVQGEKISVSRLNAANKEVDLSAEKGPIDSYFKGSNWFIDNEGYLVLEKKDASQNVGQNTLESGSGETQTGTTLGSLIELSHISDEMSVTTSSLSISGNIFSQDVAALSFNNQSASINPDRSFQLNNLPLTASMNDIIVKLYDAQKNILEKNVFTVYTSNPVKTAKAETVSQTASPEEKTNTQSPPQSRNNSQVNPNDFGFTEPSTSGKFTTNGSEITLRGFTNASGITAVQVNGSPLSSFNGKTWRYHAFERFETLEEGTNQYKVDYFGADGSIVYSDYFTIVKNKNAPLDSQTNTSTASETTAESE